MIKGVKGVGIGGTVTKKVFDDVQNFSVVMSEGISCGVCVLGFMLRLYHPSQGPRQRD